MINPKILYLENRIRKLSTKPMQNANLIRKANRKLRKLVS